jgi:dipeptidyl aminopeptidase/acylaminoacyl peptidase
VKPGLDEQPPNVDHHLWTAVRRFVRQGLDAATANGVAASLQAPQGWVDAWVTTGCRLEADARATAEAGNAAAAREQFTQAFFAFRVADFSVLDNSARKRDIYSRTIECWTAATTGAALEPVRLSAGEGLEGFLVRPLEPSTGRLPAVLYVHGADSNKEEQYWNTMPLVVERGMAFCCFDAPGQGWARKMEGIPSRPDFEVPGAQMLAALLQHEDIDPDRVVVWGSSMGGYYGSRMYAALPQLRACLLNSAIVDVLDGLYRFYPPIVPQLLYNLDSDGSDIEARLAEFTSRDMVASLAGRPLSVWHGGRDEIVDPAQAHELAALSGLDPRDLHVIPEGTHNLGNLWAHVAPQMADWLAAATR